MLAMDRACELILICNPREPLSVCMSWSFFFFLELLAQELVALAVAAAVAHTGFEVGAQALDELTDATVDAATARELEAALSAADGLRLEHARQGGGGRIIATVALEVDDAASAGDVARAQRKVEQDLGAVSENVEMVFKLEVKPSEHSWANWVTKPSPIVVDALQDPFLARMAPVNKEEAALFRP